MRPTIYRKNWPHRSNEDSQEVGGDRSSYVVPTGDSIIIIIIIIIIGALADDSITRPLLLQGASALQNVFIILYCVDFDN